MILSHARLPVPALPQVQNPVKMLAKKRLRGNVHTSKQIPQSISPVSPVFKGGFASFKSPS
jgi:hypothetical protein